jgi:hypothetical protein
VGAQGAPVKLHHEALGRSQRYGVADVGHVLVALAYFDDADRERTPILLLRQSWPAMKNTIQGWLTGATRRRRGTPAR